MPRPIAPSRLDRLTPEQVQQFKREAREPGTQARAAAAYLVAEGDSWFDYPIGTDIIDCLRHYHGYRISNYAKAGDTLENMAYGTRFSPMQGYRPLPNDLQDVLADIERNRPAAFLISGGGNDVAGDGFAHFLDHTESTRTPFREDFAEHIIGTVLRGAYDRMIREATRKHDGVRVIAHGYGYPVPDGRGVGFGVGISFIGPWLRPALAAKRINAMTDGVRIIRRLMDRFNQMLDSLTKPHRNFRVLHLIDDIDREPAPWANELHVRNSVYKKIADRFHEAIVEGERSFVPAMRKPRRKGRQRRRAARRD